MRSRSGRLKEFFQRGDDFHVGGEPVHAAEFCGAEPPGGLVLQKLGSLAARDGAEITNHSQVECGVVVIDCTNEISDSNVDGKFLPQFTRQRLLRGFPRFHFAAREFPEVLVVAVAPLGRIIPDTWRARCSRIPERIRANDACHDFYAFHACKNKKKQEWSFSFSNSAIGC